MAPVPCSGVGAVARPGVVAVALSFDEWELVRRLVRAARAGVDDGEVAGRLEELERRVGREARLVWPGWCRHCGAGRRRASNGLCAACEAYRRKNGRVPPGSVLVLRERRRQRARELVGVG